MDRINGTSHVPAFLGKLWKIVDDPSTNHLICWSESGKSFIIRNQSKFSRELLPLYYKHNNMASFVRQLNMYGFHKVISVEQGGLRLDRDEMEFAHAFFVQGNEDALEFIKRKISTSKMEELKGRPESFNKVLMDVRQMKGRQEAMDSKLVSVKRENEALWRELSQLRQKHSKQQQIVSKLLQFLVSMMSSQQSHRISFKRRMPLMLNDVEDESKPAKLSRPTKMSDEEASVESNSGPVIHEVYELEGEEPMVLMSVPNEAITTTDQQPSSDERVLNSQLLRVENLLNTAAETDTIGSNNLSPTVTTDVKVESPGMAGGEADSFADRNQEFLNAQDQNVAAGSPIAAANTSISNVVPDESMQLMRDDFDGHLDEVQVGLDGLKDLLQGSTYNIDNTTLSGLFGGIQETDLPLFELTREDRNEKKVKDASLGLTRGDVPDAIATGTTGSDLVAYNPCLFELADDDSQFFDTPNDNIFLDDELDMMLTTDRNKLHSGSFGLP